MIDTDKYEGHTEGPWAWERGALNVLHVKDSEPIHTLLHDEKKDADAKLIADAPLLLAEVMRLRERVTTEKNLKLWEKAEVKRLREALVTVQRSLIWDEEDRTMDGDPITLEALVAQVEQVRNDITEMIE